MPTSMFDLDEAIEEVATERWTGCWFGCGQRIERGSLRVRLRQYLFHPDCFQRWVKKERSERAEVTGGDRDGN